MRTETFAVETEGRLVSDITDRVVGFAASAGADGLLNVFLPHATAGLALMEAGSGSEEDLAMAIERILPRGERYQHRHGSPGHGTDHLVPTLISPSLTLPVEGGRVALGTWQSVVIVDPNRDNNRRNVKLSFLQG